MEGYHLSYIEEFKLVNMFTNVYASRYNKIYWIWDAQDVGQQLYGVNAM